LTKSIKKYYAIDTPKFVSIILILKGKIFVKMGIIVTVVNITKLRLGSYRYRTL